jgi:Phytanoyl-CoA dioxygenase (PhyH)
MENINYTDLETKGFLIIKSFFNTEIIESVKKYYALELAKNQILGNSNKNHDILKASKTAVALVSTQLTQLMNDINQNTSIVVNTIPNASTYISNQLANHGWHQDHEMYYTWQSCLNQLNFWIPLIKPDPDQSGMDFIPHDVLKERCPDLYDRYIVGKGAKRIVPGYDNTSIIADDETGDNYPVSFDLNELAVTPEISVGDLVILRPDTFHKTQDTNTPRVAFSVRCVDINMVIRKDVFYSGCARKRTMIQNNLASYQRIIDQFETKDQCTLADIHVV